MIEDRCSDRRVLDRPIPSRGLEMKRLAFLAALDRIATVPRSKKPAEWRVELRQLFEVSPGAGLDIPGSAPTPSRHPRQTTVAGAAAGLWRYPRGFVIANREPPSSIVVARCLEARKGRRLFAG